MEILKRSILKSLQWELNEGESSGDAKGRGENEWQFKEEVGLPTIGPHAGRHRAGGRQKMGDLNLSFPQVVLIYMPLLLLAQATTLNTILIFKIYLSFAQDNQQLWSQYLIWRSVKNKGLSLGEELPVLCLEHQCRYTSFLCTSLHRTTPTLRF